MYDQIVSAPVLANVVVAAYNVAVIWLMQLIIYPSWAFIPTDQFGDAQGVHFWRLFLVVFPQAVLATVLAIMLWRRPPPEAPAVALRAGVVIQVALWVLTAALWGRWQGQLALGSADGAVADGAVGPLGPANAELYQLLVNTHWLRVALITAHGVLAVWVARTSSARR